MNNEIKEILDKLKDGNWYDELDLTGTMWIELKWEETHLLLDYITNLQKTNKNHSKKLIELGNKITNLQQELEIMVKDDERSQETIIRLTKENERLKEWKKDLLNENIELENIRKEAIEYINNFWREKSYYESVENCLKFATMNEFEKEDLLNILQNGSEKDE